MPIFKSFNTYLAQFLDFRLRRVNGYRWWLIAIAVAAGVTIGNLLFIHFRLPQSPYLSTFIVAFLVLANRLCVRAGLLATVVGIPAFNYMVGVREPDIGVMVFHAPDGWEVVSWLSTFVGCLLIAPRRIREQGNPRIYDRGSDLPFTSDRPDGTNGPNDQSLHGRGARYWDVLPVHIWARDCEVGQVYAHMLLDRARAGEPHPLVAWVVRDMMYAAVQRAAAGEPIYTGVECGFMQSLAREGRAAIVELAKISRELPPR